MAIKISRFVKLPKELNDEQIIEYFKKWGIFNFFKKYFVTFLEKKTSESLKNLSKSKITYGPELRDLYKLHSSIILNKRLTVLEFGSGWSSLIICHALNVNKKKYGSKSNKLRKSNKFENHSIENERKFLNISKNRIKKFLGSNCGANFYYSDCRMTTFNGRICTEYKKIPNINPDFIYLDGPDQFNVKNDSSGFSTRHQDMMPMVCDILKIESFLVPGTIIIVDGRTANSLFLKNNFLRNWIYSYDKKNDQNLFFLNDHSFGVVNDERKNFYKLKG